MAENLVDIDENCARAALDSKLVKTMQEIAKWSKVMSHGCTIVTYTLIVGAIGGRTARRLCLKSRVL